MGTIKNCGLEMTTLCPIFVTLVKKVVHIKDFKFSNLYAYFEMPNAPVHQLVRVNGKCANPYF